MKVRPPVVAAGCLTAAVFLDRRLPGSVRLPTAVRPVGGALLAGGVSLPVWALRLFLARDTTYEPFETPTALVASGPYRYTRNPMYLGMLLVLAGIGLLTRRPALLLAPAAFFVVMDQTQIPREERLLDQQFGAAYREYRRAVQRWL